jgi:hypothetical protein
LTNGVAQSKKEAKKIALEKMLFEILEKKIFKYGITSSTYIPSIINKY